MDNPRSAQENYVRQPRQIIVGCDGTNNTLTGGLHDTNVLKLIGQLVPEDDDQILYYDPGVGSPDQVPPLGFVNDMRRKFERLAGLASGRGIYENIAEAYLFLVDHYQPGDQIYLFGFSRGAFTARSVAGMVNLFGIVRTDSKSLILTLIRVYFSTPCDNIADDVWGYQNSIAKRTRAHKDANEKVASETGIASSDISEQNIKDYLIRTKERRSTRKEVADQVREKFASAEGAAASIHFIGVWDTVESVGIWGLKRKITSDGHTRGKPCFRHIRHALSMDEHRLTFTPRLFWDPDYDDDEADPAMHRSLQQRWFRGAHSDIGGGYDSKEAGLSDQAYRWMLDEAIACGLRTEPKRHQPEHGRKPYIAHDPGFNTPWWGVAGLTVRTNVTHYKDGEAKPVAVNTEGVGKEDNPRIYSVWNTALRVARGGTLAALVAVLLSFCWYGWQGAEAFRTGYANPLATIWHGAVGLELWKASYFLGFFRDMGLLNNWTTLGPTLFYVTPAAVATLIDFGLIAAYSWLVGLYGTWAFHAMVGRRDPREKIPWMFKLGYAPMILVLANVVENFLSLITLWCVAEFLQGWSYVFGAAMTIAWVIKWLGLVGTLALLICGLWRGIAHFRQRPGTGQRIGKRFPAVRDVLTPPVKTASPPVRHRRGWPR